MDSFLNFSGKKVRHLVLFSDGMLLATAKKDGLSFKQMVKFYPSTVLEFEGYLSNNMKSPRVPKDKEKHGEFRVELVDPNNPNGFDSVVIFFKDLPDFNAWTSALTAELGTLRFSNAVSMSPMQLYFFPFSPFSVFGAPLVDVFKKVIPADQLAMLDLSLPLKKQVNPPSAHIDLGLLVPPFFNLLTTTLEIDLMTQGIYRVAGADSENKELRARLDTSTTGKITSDSAHSHS